MSYIIYSSQEKRYHDNFAGEAGKNQRVNITLIGYSDLIYRHGVID